MATAQYVEVSAERQMSMTRAQTDQSTTLEGSMKTIEITREELNEMLLAQTSADLATILATAIEKGLDTNRPYRYVREPDGGLVFEQEEPGDFEISDPVPEAPVATV